MDLNIDMKNHCITINGVLYHLEEMRDGLCLNEGWQYRTIKHGVRTYYIEQHPDKPQSLSGNVVDGVKQLEEMFIEKYKGVSEVILTDVDEIKLLENYIDKNFDKHSGVTFGTDGFVSKSDYISVGLGGTTFHYFKNHTNDPAN